MACYSSFINDCYKVIILGKMENIFQFMNQGDSKLMNSVFLC